jgi:tetratricopeptide (TPR) repeat protein
MIKNTSFLFGLLLTLLISPNAKSTSFDVSIKSERSRSVNYYSQWRWGTPIPAPRPEIQDAVTRDNVRRQREAEAWARDPQNPVNQDPEIRTMRIDETLIFYQRRGYERYDQKDFVKSVSYFDKAIKICDICAHLYAARGLSKKRLNDFTGAMADYNLAIRLERTRVDSADTFFNRGVLKQVLNDREGAIQDLREAAKLYKQKGGNPEYYQNTINQLQKMNATL